MPNVVSILLLEPLGSRIDIRAVVGGCLHGGHCRNGAIMFIQSALLLVLHGFII